jgi:UDP-N-acetyl-2-amino-2-deoxyglucuronate dehydrogenase
VSSSKVHVGIVGLGRIARSHAAGYAALVDVAEIAGFCDVDPERAAQFEREFGGTAYSGLDELVSDPNIDAVDLILPHNLHRDAAVSVLRAGKHLLMEKPLANTYQECLQVLEAASASGVTFMVAENTRYVGAYVAAEAVLRQGVIGAVKQARTSLFSHEKTRLSQPDFWGTSYATGGGLILDSGTHSFYLLKWLLGEVRDLVAHATQVLPLASEVEDTADVMGALVSGASFSSSFTSISESPHNERLELHGTDGVIIVDLMTDPVIRVYQSRKPLAMSGLGIDVAAAGSHGWTPGGWHYESVVAEVADFVGSIVSNRDPLINSADCAYAVKIVEAAYRSIRTGERVSLGTREGVLP